MITKLFFFLSSLLARLPPDQDPAVELGSISGALEIGEEVLARWSDEGWYYRGNQYVFIFSIFSNINTDRTFFILQIFNLPLSSSFTLNGSLNKEFDCAKYRRNLKLSVKF